MTTNLLGWYGEHGEEYTALVLGFLGEQGVRVVLSGETTALVEWRYQWYLLSDNGGEVNVERLNSGALPVSVATVCAPDLGKPLTCDTIAYRLLCALNGDTIYYNYRMDDAPIRHEVHEVQA